MKKKPPCKKLIENWVTSQGVQIFEGIAYYVWDPPSLQDCYSVFVLENEDYYTAYLLGGNELSIYEGNIIENIVINL